MGLIQLLIVPITLFCLGSYENGIWMTISSILIWIDSLDIGLGNGLRNKLAAQLAHGDIEKARESVSSTFFMLIMIIIPVMSLLIGMIYFSDTYSLLNVNRSMVYNLNEVLAISILMVCLTFIFKFVGNVYLGLQLPAVNNALIAGGQTLALIGTFALYKMGVHSLVMVATVYTLSPLVVYLVAYPITFCFIHPELRPSPKYFNKKSIKELFDLGLKFFVLQIAGVVIFASSNTVISRMFSPDQVTPYQIAYRYFSVGMMLFTIFAVPFWSATTEAYERGDMEWIKRSLHKIHLVTAGIGAMMAVMVIVAEPVYRIWVGSEVHIPLPLSIGSAVYMLIIMYSLSFSYLLNGIGKLAIQLRMTVLAAILFIPIAWLLGKHIGVTGVIVALCIVNLPGAIINQIQLNKIIRGTARGIWKE